MHYIQVTYQDDSVRFCNNWEEVAEVEKEAEEKGKKIVAEEEL